MKPSKAKMLLRTMLAARYPVLLQSAPGIGKTSIVTQVATELDMDLLVSHPVISDPTDYKGLPIKVGNGAEFVPFAGFLKQLIDAYRPTVALLDDLGQAAPQVQSSAMHLLLARHIGEHRISPYVTFIACTNRKQDRSGVSGILEPVKSRFYSIIELEPDLDDFIDWGLEHGMPQVLLGFLKFRPELLMKFEPTAEIRNTPCPRTWEHAGRIYNLSPPPEILVEAIAGAVGENAAIEFKAFDDVAASLPNLKSCLEHPDMMQNYRLKEDSPDVMWAVASGIAFRVTAKLAVNFYQLLDKLPPEYSMFSLKLACKRVPELIDHDEQFARWHDKNIVIN